MQVEQPPSHQIGGNKEDVAEQEAIEKLKNADWNSPEKINESSDNNYSMEGTRQRNIVHQKKGDGTNTAQSKSQRSATQKTQKRVVKK